jgi:predicted nucleotide-binding protein
MAFEQLDRIKGSFAELPVRDEPNRKRLLNELETVLRILLSTDADRYVKEARSISFYPIAYVVPGPDHVPSTWAKGRAEMVALIESVELHVKLLGQTEATPRSLVNRDLPDTSKVFIVHGHDKAMLTAVEAFVNRVGLDGIILAEEPNRGRTLLEKFEEHGDVAYAVVLLSPDDVGRSASAKPDDKKLRPRQNVVLELGYFIGRLGRDRVAAIVDAGLDNVVEYPTDIRGIVTIHFDRANDDWKRILARELRAARLPLREDRL